MLYLLVSPNYRDNSALLFIWKRYPRACFLSFREVAGSSLVCVKDSGFTTGTLIFSRIKLE